MKLRNLITTGLMTIAMASLVILSIGCSGSDSPSGPSPAPGGGNQIYDELTISLDRLDVKYDCDYNPVGVTQPGDFYYNFNVDTLASDGTWISASAYKEANVKLSNGGYKNITNRVATFRFPRLNGQAFRVKMTLREKDVSGDDFKSSNNVVHIYNPAATQMYAPEGTNYSKWDNATKVGSMSWNVNKRDRTWVAGILTKEGCNATLSYSVTVRQVQ